MPALTYLSQNKPFFTAEWQAWILIGAVIVGVIIIVLAIYKIRKI